MCYLSTNYMTLTIGNAISIVVPDLTNSTPRGAIANIPTRNCNKSTITIIATIIKIIVQRVPSISSKKFNYNGLYTYTINFFDDTSIGNTM